jgi:Argonaute siRNA chaperone (ARC) complex subunit Arb1
MPINFHLDTEAEIKSYINIPRNFLNYLVHHDVCPEYNDDLQAARQTCNRAERELNQQSRGIHNYPGTFNRACSVLWHGYYYDLYSPEMISTGKLLTTPMTEAEAREVFVAAMASQGTDELVDRYAEQNEAGDTKVTREFESVFEVLEMQPPSSGTRDMYASESQWARSRSPSGALLGNRGSI